CLHADLHARSAYKVHFTVNRNNISNKSGSQKIKSLHPGRDHSRTLAVFNGDNSSRLIDQTHYDTAMHVAVCIRIYQLHEPPGGTPRVSNTPSLRYIYFSTGLIPVYYSLKRVHITLITSEVCVARLYFIMPHPYSKRADSGLSALALNPTSGEVR